ncbi:LacI family DNA-binding transcriptional regulator [Devosia nitrariae]|uniref:LacI family transcriptional regulator n=1 Tax=Devosia nitrariae TaxID=2071872 RepID=A0ABQ5W5P0_9HYPH|nr:LacI family DNA-binding transcriptional regulator [Devosia nitrariae]GLQ55192.1 LacI family transcriptional regulator [Devosia nitrariae]
MADIETTSERAPTMADVARAAGVSTAAVSYFLSGRTDLLKRVGPEARERISEAIASLGYVQNKTARHLRRQRTERICVLLPQLGIPFADKMAQDIYRAAQKRGYTTVVTTGKSAGTWRRVLQEVEAGLADGVIADAEPFSEEVIRELFAPLIRANRPCLVLHPTARIEDVSVVAHDRVGALRQALQHVVDQGHRHIAYVANPSDPTPSARVDLVRAFAAEHADRLDPPTILGGGHSRSTGVEVARDILALTPRPTLVLVESDFSAVAMVHEFQRAGLAVPGDIAVIGCGNAEEGAFSNPRLTTIGPFNVSLTEETDHLIDMIERRPNAAPRRFLVPWRLYLRESG